MTAGGAFCALLCESAFAVTVYISDPKGAAIKRCGIVGTKRENNFLEVTNPSTLANAAKKYTRA